MNTYTITEQQRLEAMDALYLPSMKTEAMLRQKDKAYVMLQSLTPNSGEAASNGIEQIAGAISKHITTNLYQREVLAAAQYIYHRYCTHPATSTKPAGWIATSDRLPLEADGEVLVRMRDARCEIAWATYWHGASSKFAQWTFRDPDEDETPTHWMPLPKPPQGETK